MMARTKKEIDKDLMYKKLMPSALKPAKEQSDAAEEAEAFASLSAEAAAEEVRRGRQRPVVRREVGVPFMDTQPTILINAMESAVLEKLDAVLARFKCCKCDRCKKDIVAIALNKLPAKYMVLTEGRPAPELDPQTRAQILSAMIQAVLAVRAHPRH